MPSLLRLAPANLTPKLDKPPTVIVARLARVQQDGMRSLPLVCFCPNGQSLAGHYGAVLKTSRLCHETSGHIEGVTCD
jgi:hypothetical protein